jgi:hypothetical protein
MLSNLFDDNLVGLKSPHVFRDTVRTAFPRYGHWFSCVGQEENSSVRGISRRLLGLCVSRRDQKCCWDYAYLVGTTGRASVSSIEPCTSLCRASPGQAMRQRSTLVWIK